MDVIDQHRSIVCIAKRRGKLQQQRTALHRNEDALLAKPMIVLRTYSSIRCACQWDGFNSRRANHLHAIHATRQCVCCVHISNLISLRTFKWNEYDVPVSNGFYCNRIFRTILHWIRFHCFFFFRAKAQRPVSSDGHFSSHLRNPSIFSYILKTTASTAAHRFSFWQVKVVERI